MARGALWLMGQFSLRPGARVAGCSGLWSQGASSVCSPGVALEVIPPWGQGGAPPAGGSGASCCVAHGVPGVPGLGAVLVLLTSVRRRLQGCEGCSWVGVGLG